MSLEKILTINNSIYQKYPTEKIHQLEFNEAEDGQEGHGFENTANPIVVRKPVELSINKTVTITEKMQLVKREVSPPYFDMTMSFEVSGDDVLPIGGVVSKSTYQNLGVNDISELKGNPAMVFRYKSYTSNEPEFMIIVLVPGLVGISDVIHDLEVLDLTPDPNKDTFEVTTVNPVFYHHIPTDQTISAVAIVFKCNGSYTSGYTYYKNNDLNITIPNTFSYPPSKTVNISGSLTCVGIIMEGANLMTVSSHVVVTQTDLDDINDKIVDLRNDLVSLALAFSEYTRVVKEVLDNQTEAIQALVREQNRQKTTADDAWGMLINVLDLIGAVVPDARVKAATGAIGVIIKIALKVRDYIIESGSTPYSVKMISASQYFADFIILNKYLETKTETDFSYVLGQINSIILDEIEGEIIYVEHFLVDLFGYGPVVNFINNLVIMPREEIINRNIYPSHSVIMIKSSLNRNIWYSVGGGDINSNVMSPSFVNLIEWEGKSEDLPSAVLDELKNRKLYHVRGDVCVLKYDTVMKYLRWIRANSAKYDLLINNCHDSTNRIYEFASSGRLSPGDSDLASSIFD